MMETLKNLFTGQVNPFIRYFMMALAGFLVATGVLPVTETLNFIEIGGGLLTGLAAVVWYLYSESRQALKELWAKRKA